MAVNAANIQLIMALLEDSTTLMASPGAAEVISVTEVFGGFPQRVPAGASLTNVKLGMLTRVKFLAVWGDEGISFRYEENGSDVPAHPFAFLATNTTAGMGVSEIWISNSDQEEHPITILAAE